jgi:heme a synthase
MATRQIEAVPRVDAPSAQGEAASGWWIEAIPERRRQHLRIWLLTGAVLTMLTLVIGGITRLTESGLSIVDWAPIVGAVPPLTDAQWQETFDRYRQYPEYQQLRPNMTLSEFKYIFFWEYLHRMIGRVIGLAFAIPFVYFLIKGYFNRPLLKRVLILAGLGGAQGLMGWLMVSSGLVDRPHVSHYRLGMHLTLAFAIFGCCLWFAADLRARPAMTVDADAGRFMKRGLFTLGPLLAIQIFWGALVAGLDAGVILNTFPLMNGSLLPPNGWHMSPVVLNLVENPVTVQWLHRLLGTALLAGAVVFFVRTRRVTANPEARRLNALFAGLIVLQFVLGVSTLLSHVAVPLAAAHQFTALMIFGVWLFWLHRLRGAERAAAREPLARPAPAAGVAGAR